VQNAKLQQAFAHLNLCVGDVHIRVIKCPFGL
jgi:hypothetical protein